MYIQTNCVNARTNLNGNCRNNVSFGYEQNVWEVARECARDVKEQLRWEIQDLRPAIDRLKERVKNDEDTISELKREVERLKEELASIKKSKSKISK